MGNAYVNRHITGAIVQRQSFGGWKSSSVGPGAKAGGPNYVAQLGTWYEDGIPQFRSSIQPAMQRLVARLVEQVGGLSADDRAWLELALGSDAASWGAEFGIGHDASGLRVERNEFRYRPFPRAWIRLQAGARTADLLRLLAAARLAHCSVQVSADPSVQLPGVVGGSTVSHETPEQFARRMASDRDVRVRVVGDPAGLGIANPTVGLLTGPVLATGRRELLGFLREQSISQTLHRFGHMPPAGR